MLDLIQQGNTTKRKAQTTNRLFKYHEGHNYTFYCDLETTGGDPIRHEVIEICVLVTRRGEFEVIDKFYSLVRPSQINDVTWTYGAQKVHGYTPEQAREFPDRLKVAYDFLLFCDKYRNKEAKIPQLFVCHALKHSFWNDKTNEQSYGMFDYRFLEWFFRKISDDYYWSFLKVFDLNYCLSTIWLARELGYGQKHLIENGKPQFTKSGKPKKEGNGLAIWSKRAGFELEHHKAESDTYGCLYVHKFLEENGECV